MNEEFKETIGKMSDLCAVSPNEIGNALKSVGNIETITITKKEYDILRADSEELYYQKYPTKKDNNGYQVYLDTLLLDEE